MSALELLKAYKRWYGKQEQVKESEGKEIEPIDTGKRLTLEFTGVWEEF